MGLHNGPSYEGAVFAFRLFGFGLIRPEYAEWTSVRGWEHVGWRVWRRVEVQWQVVDEK